MPVMKKPKCPRNGPSSKCNPSSITLPEDAFGGLITIDAGGGYAVTVLDAGDSDFSEMALDEYAEELFHDASNFGADSSDWSITDPAQLDTADHFQLFLKGTVPWLDSALESGSSVVFYIQE
jgi:hypothetical protein